MSLSTKLLVDTLAILFGVGAWVSVNGIWVELPLMVDGLPEGWALPSYLSVIIQIANIGPISYSALQVLRPVKKLPPFIYSLLALGCVSSFLLVLFWDETTFIGNSEHSTALFVLIFFLATVDCTSSVLYLPYMASWKSQYLPFYSVGEGLSGFLPAIVALAQGVGSSGDSGDSGGGETNLNVSTTIISLLDDTVNENGDIGPNFSVSVFFLILFFMMVASALAFMLLNVLPSIQSERSLNHQHLNISQVPTVAGSRGMSNENYHGSQFDVEKPPLKVNNLSPPEQIASVEQSDNLESTNALLVDENGSFEWPVSTLGFLLFAQFFASLLTNGFLPSIQSYSCAPYGMTAYHLAATLSAFANPCAAFSTALFPRAKMSVMATMLTIGSAFAAYIIATAALSPSPPLVDTSAGPIIVVVSWVVFTYLLSFVRVEVNNLLRMTGGQKGSRVLFWSGASTQTGSFFGALIAFVLVNIAGVFTGEY